MPANAGTSSAVGRDVVYTISFEVDPAVRTATEQLAKTTEQTFERIGRSQKKASTESSRALSDEVKAWDEKAKRLDEAAKSLEVLYVKQRTAENQISASAKQALAGVTQLGRGITLLGVVAEKDMEKAVRTFAKFEAGANVIKGLTGIIDSGRKAWEAWRVAAEAAAAARTASAAAGLLSSGSGGLGGAISAGSALDAPGAVAAGTSSVGIAALIAAIAATGWSVVEAFKGVAHEANSFTGTARGIAKSIPGVSSVFDAAVGRSRSGGALADLGNFALLGPIGAIAAASDMDASNDAVTANQRATLSRLRQQRQDEALAATIAEATRGNAQTALSNRLAGIAATAIPGTAGALAATRSQIGVLGEQGSRDALGAAGALDRQIALRQRELDLVRQLGQEQRATAEQNIRALENQLTKQRAIAEAAETRLASAAERFADLSPVEQQRAIRAKQSLDAGNRLSREDRRRLRNLGLQGPTAGVRAQDLQDADAAGFNKFFGAEEREQSRIAREEERRINVEIKREKDFIVKVESDTQAEADMLAAAVATELAKRDEELRKEFQASLQRIRDQEYERRNRDAQTAYALGGS